jgi:large subunit ribosomal protein L31
MKKGLHPTYNEDAGVVCSTCGTKYDFGSTKQNISLAICSKCHPFYTGQQQVVIDTANKISKFNDRVDKAAELKKRKEEIENQRSERAKSKVGVISNEPKLTLKDLLQANKTGDKKKK